MLLLSVEHCFDYFFNFKRGLNHIPHAVDQTNAYSSMSFSCFPCQASGGHYGYHIVFKTNLFLSPYT